MDLKEFVSETIVQISQGIVDAQERTKEYRTIVNPELIQNEENIFIKDATGRTCYPAQFLEFDVLVNVEKVDEKDTKGRIGIQSLFIGREKKNTIADEKTNRIKFTIPILFPLHKFWEDRKEEQ